MKKIRILSLAMVCSMQYAFLHTCNGGRNNNY